MVDKDELDKEPKTTPLDEEDITLLKSYVHALAASASPGNAYTPKGKGPYGNSIKGVEADIQKISKHIQELSGTLRGFLTSAAPGSHSPLSLRRRERV